MNIIEEILLSDLRAKFKKYPSDFVCKNINADGSEYQMILHKDTPLNPFKTSAIFHFQLENPYSGEPQVTLLSNLVYPSLFDETNIISEIDIKETNLLEPELPTLSNKLSAYLYNLYEQQNKGIVAPRNYKLNTLYNLNNFNMNTDFFNIKVNLICTESKKQRMLYCVLTDLHVLMFEGVPSKMFIGKLVFFADVLHVSTKPNFDYGNGVQFEWQGKEGTAVFLLIFNNLEDSDLFREEIKRKSSKLEKLDATIAEELEMNINCFERHAKIEGIDRVFH